MTRRIGQFLSDERGLEAVEYTVLTTLIVSLLVAIFVALPGAIVDAFGRIAARLAG